MSRYSKIITWPKFESDSRKHLMLGPDPEVGSHYRTDKVAVWNKLIPDLIETHNMTGDPGTLYSPGQGHREGGGSGLAVPGGSGAINYRQVDNKNMSGLVHLTNTGQGDGGLMVDTNLPMSIIVIIGLILLMFNLLACTGVYYQRQKVKRREMSLERRIKRMSDAGFVMDDSASHQSGLIVDSNVERETREEGHYGTSAPLALSGGGGQPAVSKRPHFQLRSNSVRDQGPEQGKIVLKSALKKSNTSAEILTERGEGRDSKCLLYSDQSFIDAAYPGPRQAKSIPNINHLAHSRNNDTSKDDNSLSRVSKEKQLSKSSNFLEKERRRGADELVLYDSLPSPTGTLERKPGGRLSSLANSLLRGTGMKSSGQPPSPIIEMVATSSALAAPSTYSFPSRANVSGEPIYTTRPLLHQGARGPPPLATPYGIAYPVYGHTGSLPRPLYSPRGPGDGYIHMMPRPGLTTPTGGQHRPGLHLPLGPDPAHLASLPKRPGFEVSRAGPPLRPPLSWTGSLREAHTGPEYSSHSIYGTRPPLSRMNSVDSATSVLSVPSPAFTRTAPDLLPVKMANATSQTPQTQGKPQSLLSQAQPASASRPISSVSTLSSSISTASTIQSSISPVNTISTDGSPRNLNVTHENGNDKNINPFESIENTVEISNNEYDDGALNNTDHALSHTNSPDLNDGDITDKDNGVVSPGSPKTPILRKVGEKTPPNTLMRDRSQSSCKSWYSQYSQGFLSKTIDTPDIELPPLGDEEDEDVESSDTVESGDASPNYERKIK